MLRMKRRPKRFVPHFDTLISSKTQIDGNVIFTGGLHIDGRVQGSVSAGEGEGGVTVIRLSDVGQVDGNVVASHILINGRVKGNVYASELVELASRAVVEGDVHYRLIKMSVGARVTGKLVVTEEKGDDTSSNTNEI